MKLEKIINVVNIPHHLVKHIVGENYTNKHRRIAGAVVMFFGVWLAHAAGHLGNMLISLTGDLLGYSIHATGFLPFLHDLEKTLNKKQEPEQEKDQETKCLTC